MSGGYLPAEAGFRQFIEKLEIGGLVGCRDRQASDHLYT